MLEACFGEGGDGGVMDSYSTHVSLFTSSCPLLSAWRHSQGCYRPGRQTAPSVCKNMDSSCGIGIGDKDEKESLSKR